LFEIELGTYERYLPRNRALAAVAERVRVLVSADGLPVYAEMAKRFGEELGVNIETTAGAHAAYHDHPREVTAAVGRPCKSSSRRIPGAAAPTRTGPYAARCCVSRKAQLEAGVLPRIEAGRGLGGRVP
jgi:hypothetical protein